MKSILKRSVAFLLISCLVLSILFTGIPAAHAATHNTPVVAGVGGFFAEFVGEKLLETGMRALCEGTEMLAEATGNEGFEEVVSFVNKWVLMDAAEAAAVKTQELCEEILKKLDELEIEMREYSAEIESLIGNSTYANSLTALSQQWANDVTNVMDSQYYSVSQPLSEYDTYMRMALDFANGEDGVTQEDLDEQSEKLIMSFASMYTGNISMEDRAPEKFKELIFAKDSCINDNFTNVLNNLSLRLLDTATASTNVAERAAILANDAYPFSHQQYQYVYTVIYEQFMTILQVEMLYNEFLALQGGYIKNHPNYGTESAAWDGYLLLKTSYLDLIETIVERMTQMLETEMHISDSLSLTLDDYMKPEDAVDTVLDIQDFQRDFYIDYYDYSNGYGEFSRKKYSAEKMRFDRVMANGTVYYIMDPGQFSDSLAMSAISLDYTRVYNISYDWHYTSCDYINYIKDMSDGTNTFKVPSNTEPFAALFDTNAFNLAERVPTKYLSSYLPAKNEDAVTYLVTSVYDNPSGSSMWHTTYEDFGFAIADSSVAGSVPDVIVVSAGDMQLPEGERDKFTVILANQSAVYQQKVHLKASGAPVYDMKLTTTGADGKTITIQEGQTALVPCGQTVSVSFKLHDGYLLDTLKVVRNNDTFSGSKQYRSETVLLNGAMDHGMMSIDEDGYCTFEYPMPYSDTTFELSSVREAPYYIGSAEELMAFAEDVNAGFINANAVLVSDIDLKGYDWTPIAAAADLHYGGTFDGAGHTIWNLGSLTGGLFGSSTGTIKDLTVEGTLLLKEDAENVGGVVGCVKGGTVSNVSSGVSIITEVDTACGYKHIGGVVGSLENGTVEKCTYYGELDISNAVDCFGGIVGYAGGGASIAYCANLGSVTTRKGGAFTGGILGYLNNTSASVIGCYSVGNVQCMDADESGYGPIDYTFCGAIIGNAKNVDTRKIANNYYLTSGYTFEIYPFGTTSQVKPTANEMSDRQFASGEVAYGLNLGITDGTQAWYQDIDNGETADPYPVFSGGTVYCGLDCTSKGLYSNYPVNREPHHIYDAKGFCTVCGAYQPAVLNGAGVYEISNAGQLFWFASLVNGDKTHAEFESKQPGADAILLQDIDLTDLTWVPIAEYSGTFDGAHHTISNMVILTETSYCGLFGKLYGTVKDLTVTGDIVPLRSVEHIGGIVGYVSGGTVSGCVSYVDMDMVYGDTTSVIRHLGGVVGSFYGGLVEKCLSYSKITLNEASDDCFGGVVGYAGVYLSTIDHCAFLGQIQTRNGNAFTGGILGYLNFGDVYVTNCYNYGTVSCTENGQGSDVHCGAIIGWLRYADKNKICNNYFNSETTTRSFGADGAPGFTAQAMTAQQFQSGEVAYKLNNGITDGTQVWYQDLDNGKTDPYPLFDGGTVYKLPSGQYSNEDRIADAFDRDENGDLMIKTYGDLVKLAELVRSDYDLYGSESYVLANNIFAPKDSVWSMGIGSVDENKPFNGRFHGDAHIIAGLNVACDTYGGLFEVIGQSGSVDSLFLIDCDYTDSACEYAGGIAAINHGIISECMSGLILSSEIVFTDPNTHEQITAKDFNSNIRGKNAGGIVATNYGRIEFSRNASVVTGTEIVGGIAAVNEGTIYGCANNAPIGDSTAKISGGLVGTNNGALGSGYASGKVKGKSSGSFGAIAGVNNSDDVNDIFYVVINNVDAFGKSSTVPLGTGNIKMSGTAAMQTDAFTAELNAVTDGKEWVRDDHHNQGFPAIDSKYFDIQLKSSANGITVSGVMHQDMQIEFHRCDETSEAYQQLSEHAIGKLFTIYETKITDGKSVEIPYELWSRGGIQIAIPSDDIIGVTGITAEGNIIKLETSTVAGKTLLSADAPFAYIVVSERASTPGAPDDPEIPETGDRSDVYLAAIIAIAAAFGTVLLFVLEKRSKKV